MGKTEITTSAPALFIESVSTEKPPEFLMALKEYLRADRNEDRQNNALRYLLRQSSYAFRIFKALKADGITRLMVRQDNAGNYAVIPATRENFARAYTAVKNALYAAQNNGVSVVSAEAIPRKDGSEYVRISACAGIIGVE